MIEVVREGNVVKVRICNYAFFSKQRVVEIGVGGGKYISYIYRLFGLKIYTERQVYNGSQAIIDGGGNMAWSLGEYLKDCSKDELENLYSDLDIDSVKRLKLIVERLIFSVNNYCKPISDLSKYEANILNDIYGNFVKSISKRDGYYCYDNMLLPVNQFEVSVFYHHHGMNNFKSLVNIRNKDIIDVGAYIGDSATVLANFTNHNIYCFEIDKNNCDICRETVQLNNLKNVKIINKGLSNYDFYANIEFGGIGSRLSDANNDGELCHFTTLDAFAKLEGLDNIGFIKVDIEGEEKNFLLGAKNVIISQKPAMLISIYHNYRDLFEIKPLIQSWNCGYKFKIYKPIDFSVSAELALLCEVV